MADTVPNSTPNGYSVPDISRGSTLISELNIVVPRTKLEFFKKYNFMPYMMLAQLRGGLLKISDKSENRQFYHYEQYGRYLGYVTAASNAASSGVNTSVTVPIAIGGYSVNGTRSLPDVGMVVYNAQSGVESQVIDVNKNTPYAHTITIFPVVNTTDAVVVQGQELQCRGYKYQGEESDYTGTDVMNISKYTNYCTTFRKDLKITDLAQMERIDFPFKGRNFYKMKALDDMVHEYAMQMELLLLDSNLVDTVLAEGENGTLGMKQWIRPNGINVAYPQFSVQGTLADLERKIDAEAGPMEYDWLMDTNQHIDVNYQLGNEFNNGAIVYDENDLKYGFKSYTPLGRKLNLTRYCSISDAKMWGSKKQTLTTNSGYMIPLGTRTLNGDMKANDMPQMIRRYQEFEGRQVYHWETGPQSPNGKTTKLNLVVSTVEYPGLTMQGSNQFVSIKKG